MKTMTKKLGAIILALAMCFSLTCVAFAAEGDYTITIKNATIGENYAAYKIFDATYTTGTDENGDPVSYVSYTISTSSALYESIAALTDVFELKAATDNATTYYVTVKDGVEDADVIAAIESLDIENLVTASASTGEGGATSTTLVLDVGEPGYYYVTSSVGTLVTITTADPTATVVDKNEVVGQDFYKYIVDEDGNLIQYGDAALGDELNFDITSNVPLYEGNDTVLEYQFTDTLSDDGMTIEIEKEDTEGQLPYITVTDGHYYATEELINTFVTMTDSSDNTYKLSDVAYGITLEFTDVEEIEIDGQEYVTCGGFILTYYTYNTETYATDGTYDFSKYLTDLTIDIKYTTYVTNEANHFEANTAVLNYWVGPNIPGTNSGKTSTDYVYDWDLKIVKTDGTGDDANLLKGATFTLAGENLKHVSVHTEYVYTLVPDGTELDPNTTYFYLLADGHWTTVAPTEETADQYDPDYPGPYTRSVSSDTVIEDADTQTITGTTDENGVIIFDGLTEGTYTLTEIVAPDGYNLLSAPIVFEVTFDSATGIFNVTVTSGLSGNVTFDNDLEEVAFTIVNNAGSELPSTGGIGTTIFYIIGGVLVAGAVVVLITRRRMNSAD